MKDTYHHKNSNDSDVSDEVENISLREPSSSKQRSSGDIFVNANIFTPIRKRRRGQQGKNILI